MLNRIEKSTFLSIILGLCLYASNAFARKIELHIDTRDLRLSGLQVPQSAAYLNFEKTTGDELSGLCPVKGFHVQPMRSAGDEVVSRSLKIRFTKGRPELDECIRDQACFAVDPQKQQIEKNGPATFYFSGRAGSYRLTLDSPSELPNQQINCTSSAVEIMQNSQGQLKIPSMLWVLNYRSEIVLWNGLDKRSWFRIRLPPEQLLSKKFNAAADSSGRLLISDQSGSILFLDFNLNHALLKAEKVLFQSFFGLGGVSYSNEWQVVHSAPFSLDVPPRNTSSTGKQPFFAGLSGFAKSFEFWTWENAINALRGLGGKSFPLGGALLTASEKITDDSHEVFFAIRNTANTADVKSYHSGGVTIRTARKDQSLDERASNHDFLIIGKELYRHTADGIYRVDSNIERTTSLKGFKGVVEGQTHFFVTRSYNGKNCSLNVWPVNMEFSGIFEPSTQSIGCNGAQAIAVSPWGYSVTWKEASKIKAFLSTND
jgi:hypothetical protein